MRVKEESEEAGLNFSIKKNKIMASDPITSWQVEAVTVFLSLGSKITADGDCSHAIRRRLLLGRKAMTNPDSVLNRKDITLPTNIQVVKAMVLPIVIYRCESWTMKQAEH